MKPFAKISLFAAMMLATGLASADGTIHLFRIKSPVGDCQVRPKGKMEFEPVMKGKAYPFGSAVKTGIGSSVVMMLTDNDAVRLLDNASASVELDPENDSGKIINLKHGTMLVRLNAADVNNDVIVETPVGRGISMVGNIKFIVDVTAKEENVLELRGETACQMKFIGPQFVIPSIKDGNGIKITTYKDESMTRIQDLIGDYKVYVNKGTDINPDTSDLEGSEVLLPVAMSSQSAVKIWREKAPVGNRLIVSVLSTGPDGKGRESYAFAVGKDNVVTRSNVFDLPPVADGEQDDGGLFATPVVTEDATVGNAAVTEDETVTDGAATSTKEDNSLDDYLF